jgi:hypothetical protein
MRRALANAYSLIHAAYRHASLQLKRGLGPVEFPPGCFPPRLPLESHSARCHDPSRADGSSFLLHPFLR